jgi:uncharacterized Ntn-hydrolase superfamily protein
MIAAGLSAESAMAAVTAEARHVSFRQLAVVDSRGRTAVFSGEHTLGRYAAHAAIGSAAAGNLLADERIPARMIEVFAQVSDQHIGDRLVGALRAGRDGGGEEGPLHSAALVIVDTVPWPVSSLRIDWTDGDPVEELAMLWERWKPLADGYVIRALDPANAPGFGVPGDPEKDSVSPTRG